MTDMPLAAQYMYENYKIIIAIGSALALCLAPVITIQIQKALENDKQAKERRLEIFKALLATRSSKLSPDRIRALSMIDVEFYGKNRKHRKVIKAWDEYRDSLVNLNSSIPTPNGASNETKQILNSVGNELAKLVTYRREDYFTDLLEALAECCGFNFRRTDLRNNSYYPQGLEIAELESNLLRRQLLNATAPGVLVVGDPSQYPDLYSPRQTQAVDQAIEINEGVVLPQSNQGMSNPISETTSCAITSPEIQTSQPPA